MNIADKTILITGASRGIGRALIDEALRRGARRVYAGTRGPLPHADARVTAVKLDVTSAADIQRAAGAIDRLDVLPDSSGARRTSSPIRHRSRSRTVGAMAPPRRSSGSSRPSSPAARPESERITTILLLPAALRMT